MCASCGDPVHAVASPAVAAAPAPLARFTALKNRGCRTYLIGAGLAMMADNIEHVITYEVLWDRFHSEALVGFQVISHWLPFLLLSVTFGALADHYDCRRVIQAGQALFALVSIAWGVLFVTGTLSVAAACVLLVLHGIAGALWGPAEQLMLHDFVGDRELASAVRLNSTFRSLGILFGPVVGTVLLLGLGPTNGIFANALIYLPLIVFLFRTRVTGHTRRVGERSRIGLRDSLRVLRDVRGDRTIITMIVLAGLGACFVGASLQAAMPALADTIGRDATVYGALLVALGAGGVVGGLLLEVAQRIRPTVRAALVGSAVYGAAVLVFALTDLLPVALVLLFATGVASLASMSIGQTVVQLRARPGERGRVVGLFNVSANGLRLGSGLTVGLLGTLIGVRASLAASAVALCVGTACTAAHAIRGRERTTEPPEPALQREAR